MKPEEAESVMRQIKNGIIGNAFMAFGWAAYQNLAGQYQRGKKDEPGSATIFGVTVPSALLHHPAIEAAN